jgi:hypothetical protein
MTEADAGLRQGLNWKTSSWTDPSAKVTVSFRQPVHALCVFQTYV